MFSVLTFKTLGVGDHYNVDDFYFFGLKVMGACCSYSGKQRSETVIG